MKKKTKQDFQELLKTEHCKKTELLTSQEVTSSGLHLSVWAFFGHLSICLLQLYLKDLKSVNVFLS